MAYYKKRNYGRKRQGGGRRGGRSQFTSTLYKGASTASKALALAKSAVSTAAMLKGIINSEKKKVDIDVSAATLDRAGTVWHLTQISQGDTLSQRNGNSILLKHVSIRCYLNAATSSVGDLCRLYVIQDTQQVSDATPTFADIFYTVNGNMLLNTNTVGRYRILAQKDVHLSTAGQALKSCDLDIPMDDHVRYNGTAATDVQKGGIYLVAMSTVTTGAVNKPGITWLSRCTYYDN